MWAANLIEWLAMVNVNEACAQVTVESSEIEIANNALTSVVLYARGSCSGVTLVCIHHYLPNCTIKISVV